MGMGTVPRHPYRPGRSVRVSAAGAPEWSPPDSSAPPPARPSPNQRDAAMAKHDGRRHVGFPRTRLPPMGQPQP